MARATTPVPVPTDPVALLSTPLARSGLAAGALLRRAGIRLGFYTVRDLLFHLPRRYDDLREMRELGDLVWVEDGTVVSARVRVADVRVEPTLPAPRPADDRPARGRHRQRSTRPGSAAGSSSAGCSVGGEVVVSGRVKHFGRRLTFDNPEFQAVGGATPRSSTPAGSCRSTR